MKYKSIFNKDYMLDSIIVIIYIYISYRDDDQVIIPIDNSQV